MPDLLVVWGVSQTTCWVFRPILEDLAKDVAKDAAKSYVGRCFKNVFSIIHRDPLAKATGLAIKELLELIESELIRADVEEGRLNDWVDDVQRFVKRDEVREAISSLFLQPDYHLDPKTFATAWKQLDGAHTLPEDFSWPFIAKRLTVKVAEIRHSSTELEEMFSSLTKTQDAKALQELAGLPPDFNLENYREALVERYGNLDFASLDTTGAYYNNVRLWNVFVAQSVRECHEYDPQLLEVPKEHLQRLALAGELEAEQIAESEKLHHERRQAYVNQSPRPVLGVAGDSTIACLVLLGDPGSGKSSLLRFLAMRWARIDDTNLRYTQPLPLLIELREYNRWNCTSGKSFPKYLHEAPNWHQLNQQTLKHLLKQPGRVLLLLDGLDEVFDAVERERVVNDIHRFSNDYKHVRIVVTSRVVGYKPQRLRDADFRHFMLQDLDDDQISNFLNKWHDVTFDKPQEAASKRERLDVAIKNSKSISQLAGNPLLLTMMAILNRNQKLPDDRVDLYQQCSRLLLHQWDVEGKLLEEFPGLSDEIGLREKTDILRAIAYAMQTGIKSLSTGGRGEGVPNVEPLSTQKENSISSSQSANYIDRQTLESLIEDYLHTELHFDQARAVARALVEQLRARNFILCYLGADSYAFVHRTFLEYFCAADIVHQFNVAKTLDLQGLIDLFDDHCRDDDWNEVLRLICGQIDEPFVGHIVEHLATRTDLEKWDGKTLLPELPLAIWCLNEVRNPQKLQASGALLLDRTIELTTVAGDFVELNDFIRGILTAARDIGPEWPGKERLAECAVSQSNLIRGWGDVIWSELVSAIVPDEKILVELTKADRWRIRVGAINELESNWANESTRELLTRLADLDDNEYPRLSAIEALATQWPDKNTRELITQQATQDDSSFTRRSTLQLLAEKWPDEDTRELLTQRAVQDHHDSTRSTALRTLAAQWPDENSRKLLILRAVEDHHQLTRSTALLTLAEQWPDENTHELLTQWALHSEDKETRGNAFSILGNMYSEFGRILTSQDLDGSRPYLDPLEPPPLVHIEMAAKKVGIRPEDIDDHVSALSAHVGWDITLGLGTDGQNKG